MNSSVLNVTLTISLVLVLFFWYLRFRSTLLRDNNPDRQQQQASIQMDTVRSKSILGAQRAERFNCPRKAEHRLLSMCRAPHHSVRAMIVEQKDEWVLFSGDELQIGPSVRGDVIEGDVVVKVYYVVGFEPRREQEITKDPCPRRVKESLLHDDGSLNMQCIQDVQRFSNEQEAIQFLWPRDGTLTFDHSLLVRSTNPHDRAVYAVRTTGRCEEAVRGDDATHPKGSSKIGWKICRLLL